MTEHFCEHSFNLEEYAHIPGDPCRFCGAPDPFAMWRTMRAKRKPIKSWAVIDVDGEEFISAKTILFSAAGDIGRAKRLAKAEAAYINEDEGPGTVTIELRALEG